MSNSPCRKTNVLLFSLLFLAHSGEALTGGTEVEDGAALFAVAIVKNKTTICTGSVISYWDVLTTASCAAQGSKDELKLVDTEKQEHPVEEIIVHVSYKPETGEYDVAILRSSKAFEAKHRYGKIPQIIPMYEGTVENSWTRGDFFGYSGSTLYNVSMRIQKVEDCWHHIRDFDADIYFCAGDIHYRHNAGNASSEIGGAFVIDGGLAGVLKYYEKDDPIKEPALFTKISVIRAMINRSIKTITPEQDAENKRKAEEENQPSVWDDIELGLYHL